MTMKRVETGVDLSAVPMLDLASLPNDLATAAKFTTPPSDEDMPAVAALRASSEPWRSRGEGMEESLQALTQLRPYVHLMKLQGQPVGYVTVERDGPVPGAAYMRNIVVKPELRRKGLATEKLEGTTTPAWTWKLMLLTLTRGALLARNTDCCSVVCCCAVRLVLV